jgi:hypothetical protein
MATKRVSESKVSVSSGAGAVPARRKAPATKRAARPATVTSTPEVVPVEPVMEVTNEAVAQLAYSYWEARGYQGGSPEEDWLRAEQALRAVTASK